MGRIRLTGATSGYTELRAANAAGNNTIILPTTNGGEVIVSDSSGNVNIDSGTFYVDASNNRVGVGTTSPAYPLDLGTSNDGRARQWLATTSFIGDQGDSTGFQIRALGAGTSGMKFANYANNVEYGRFDSSGRLGIGTSAPSTTLEVNGITTIKSGAFDQGGLKLNYTSNVDSRNWYIRNDINAFGDLGIQQSTTQTGNIYNTRLYINPSGSVGIGTTSPANLASLHVNGSIISTSPTINTFNFDNTGFDYASNNGRFFATATGASGGNLTFTTGNNGSYNERARIDSSGRLLVGTSSYSTPSGSGSAQYAPLVVQGYTGGSTGAGIVTIANGTAGASITNNTVIGVLSFAGNNASEFATVKAEADATCGANDYPGRLVFSVTRDGQASPTEALRISNQGDISHSHQKIGDWAVASYNTSSSAGNVYGARLRFSNKTPNDATSIFLSCEDSTAIRAEIRSNGGLANYSANNANLSDRNAKKDISPAAGTWDCIKEWEIVNYRYKDQPDDADLNLGVIAQQVAESCPEVITVFQEAKEATGTEPAQEERLGVKEQQMYWMAIKALQEAQARIETLEAKVAALESA